MKSPLRLNRRAVLTAAATLAAGGVSAALAKTKPAATEAAFVQSPFRTVTDAEWRERLGPASYGVLRRQGTETPGTSPLLKEHRKGVFTCMGCDLPLFRSETKFESDTGWPSFFRAIDANIAKKFDFSAGMTRTEYHCAQCLGHQGHLFNDGPGPTGLRYCNNGVALRFVPDQA
jgi:peptide-methionine (R)-S-oxide reductase